MSLNHIVIMGRLVRDPELRRTQNGTAVTTFTLAVDRDFKSKTTGEKETDFIDVVAWRATAEFVCNYFTKGRMAIAEGRLQLRDWKDKDGNNRRAAEVVADNVYFGDSKRDGAPAGGGEGPSYASAPGAGSYGASGGYGAPLSSGYPPPPQSGGAPGGYSAGGFVELDDEQEGDLPF